ncbi:MAG: CrcB family protein [Lacunisphaera sp.]|nr:CrcB family protein [Lacunisphaera sp.]
MNVMTLCLVAAGGALGSVARLLMSWALPAGRLPWATIITNILGSLLIGWLLSRLGPLTGENWRAHGFWVVGLCGGFTTFSAFSLQTFEQIQRGDWPAAAANVLLSVGLCLLATWAGWRIGK